MIHAIMSKMSVQFSRFMELGEVPDNKLDFVIIVARHKGQWLFCRHKNRDTWEIPGGKREPGETITEAAHRELHEETGATKASITPICIFVVKKEAESFGLVAFADVEEIDAMPECEMSEFKLFDEPPPNQTYEYVHPKVFDRVIEYITRHRL